MKKLDKSIKFLPLVGYWGFFLMQVKIGFLLISVWLPSPTVGLIVPPLYQPLTYLDLLILLAMNIPTFIIVVVAYMKIRDKKD